MESPDWVPDIPKATDVILPHSTQSIRWKKYCPFSLLTRKQGEMLMFKGERDTESTANMVQEEWGVGLGVQSVATGD